MSAGFQSITNLRRDDIVILATRSWEKPRQQGRRTGQPPSLDIQTVRIAHKKYGTRVVLVELPGFGRANRSTVWSDLQVLGAMSGWLQMTYQNDIRISGVIYLQRITDDPEAIGPQKNFRFLYDICGDVFLRKTVNLVLATTMWDKNTQKAGVAREKELRSKTWKRSIDEGAKIDRLGSGREDVWRVLTKAIPKDFQGGSLLLQEQLFISDQDQALQLVFAKIEKSNDLASGKYLEQQCNQYVMDLQKAKEEVKQLEIWPRPRESAARTDTYSRSAANPSPGQPEPVSQGATQAYNYQPPSSGSLTYTTPALPTRVESQPRGFGDRQTSRTSTASSATLQHSWQFIADYAKQDGSLTANHGDLKNQSEPISDEVSRELRSLALEIARNKEKRTALAGLQGEDAQVIADFLDQLLNETGTNALQAEERKSVLSLLTKLAKSAQVFPGCYELKEVSCDLDMPLYEGGFGVIYKGDYQGQAICVKAIRMNEKQKTRLIQAQAKEFIIWAHLSHPRILPFYGVFQSEKMKLRICLVSPWMPNGDLNQYLEENTETPRIPLIIDITAGLRYLHELKIVHGDLKAKNILISKDKRAMIADFGISYVNLTGVSTGDTGGTLNWMAPEICISGGQAPVTVESDMWSFGCVFTGMIPFFQYNQKQLFVAFCKGHITPFTVPRGSLDSEVKIPDPLDIDARIRMLMGMCWEHEPKNRPTSVAIHNAVVGMEISDDRSDTDIFSFGKSVRPKTVIDYQLTCGLLSRIVDDMKPTLGDASVPIANLKDVEA
ncbi:Serine/threonine-protein kinase HT1 [Leucoagaricus sp. SymC.cos]|nr:Serine/threonine-protein kinase HT1 [Leucoagaricus sp. SymC.cos]